MTKLTSFFVVEYQTSDSEDSEPYFYYGPAMDILEWQEFITHVKKLAIRQLAKEEKNTGTPVNPSTVKFRIDLLLKERGFFKHVINVAEVNPDSFTTKINTKIKSKSRKISNSNLTLIAV